MCDLRCIVSPDCSVVSKSVARGVEHQNSEFAYEEVLCDVCPSSGRG